MNSSNEVFLGQKKLIARFNLDTREAVWSKDSDNTPTIITTCGENILVQSVNAWGTKHSHQLLNAQTGDVIWTTDKIKGWVTPQYHKGNIFFINSKNLVSKLCGDKGEILFETKFKKWYEHGFLLTIAKDKIYLLSKKKSFLVEVNSGECIEIRQLANFIKNPLTAACGNGVDQMALFSVLAATTSSGDAGTASYAGGGGGGE